MTFKYREHRELLVESMRTVKEFNGKDDLIRFLQHDLNRWGVGKYDLNKITIEKYGDEIDTRIGWDTHIVHLKGYGVLGFTDGMVSNT